MVKRLVLDLTASEGEALDSKLQRLSSLSMKPEVVVGRDVRLGPGDLLVTNDDDRAVAAVQSGATAWRVRPGTGELDSWDDLPLAIAFANGTLDDFREALNQRPELKGETIRSISWTPNGDVTGLTSPGTPLFATAGPRGETPQIFLGTDAEEREKAARTFMQTLIDNQQVSTAGNLTSGQTHTLTDGEGRRPVLKRERFYLMKDVDKED